MGCCLNFFLQNGKDVVTLKHKALFMPETTPHLDALQDIKEMMSRSSRFISLSGWSGISAGVCALIGAWVANTIFYDETGIASGYSQPENYKVSTPFDLTHIVSNKLFIVAVVTFIVAFMLAFFFTFLRSRKNNFSIWGSAARRLMINVSLPMIVGGIFILKLLQTGEYGLIAPACLIFYGLALVNASKYTLGEVRYLGYGQILLGLINCWVPGYGLYFWAAGFGVLHIIYGALMLWKYER